MGFLGGGTVGSFCVGFLLGVAPRVQALGLRVQIWV